MEFMLPLFWIGVNFAIGFAIGKPKNMAAAGAILSVVLGPIGWIITLCSTGDLRPCPHCAEKVKPDAKVCRYCGRDLPALPAPEPVKPDSPYAVAAMAVILILIAGYFIYSLNFTYKAAAVVNPEPEPVPLTTWTTTPSPKFGESASSIPEPQDVQLMRRMGFSQQDIDRIAKRR